MSRIYEEWCPACNQYKARTLYLNDDIELVQCRNCGACHKKVTKTTLLKTTGTDEKAWKKAEQEARRGK